VLWIREILVRSESEPLTYGSGSGSGSWYFRPWPSKRRQKLFFPSFSLYLVEGTFTSFFSDKKVMKKSKTVGIKVFFSYFCLMIEGSGSVPLTYGSGSRRPKNINTIKLVIYISNIKEWQLYPQALKSSPTWENKEVTTLHGVANRHLKNLFKKGLDVGKRQK
jgi:hypothetical protein